MYILYYSASCQLGHSLSPCAVSDLRENMKGLRTRCMRVIHQWELVSYKQSEE